MTDLLDAVDALTQPRRRHETQDVLSDDGRITGARRTLIVHEPLLEQLATAIRSNVGGSSRGASTAFERNPLALDALHQTVRIEDTLRQWCKIAQIPTRTTTTDTLRAWHAHTLHLDLHPATIRHRVKTLHRWTAQIDAILDPHRERELLHETCPACGAADWWRDGARYLHPLVIRYRPTGADLVQQARGLCRACETVWGVRSLAYELEQARTRHNLQEHA